jgi:uncharacterized protein
VLAPGSSGSVKSVNDGRLVDRRAMTAPDTAAGSDDYRIDYTVTLGASNRWTATAGGAPGPVRDYPDLKEHDRRSLTYTTPALAAPMEVTGHPTVRLWLSTTEPDADVFVTLEDVRPDGYSDYVTEGRLRASHRLLAEAPYDRLGLPYHRSFAEDRLPMTAEPALLQFDLLPTSKIFRLGHRIRIAITGADYGNFATPVVLPPPGLRVHRGPGRVSSVSLPVVGVK